MTLPLAVTGIIFLNPVIVETNSNVNDKKLYGF